MSLFSVGLAQSIAASGTASVTIPVSSSGNVGRAVNIVIAAKYAAVAATSGIQAAFQYSADGTTFSNANEPNVVVAPAATVLGSGETVIRVSGPARLDGGPIVSIKVNLTNLDATNAATVAVASEASTTP